MERPTDTFKETHNITLSQEDTLFGGLVSNLQVFILLSYLAAPFYLRLEHRSLFFLLNNSIVSFKLLYLGGRANGMHR